MRNYLIVIGIFLITHSVAYWAGMEHEQNNQIQIELIAEKAANTASEAAAKAIASIEIKQTTINNKVHEIMTTKTIYTDCRHSAEAFKLIRDKFHD